MQEKRIPECLEFWVGKAFCREKTARELWTVNFVSGKNCIWGREGYTKKPKEKG